MINDNTSMSSMELVLMEAQSASLLADTIPEKLRTAQDLSQDEKVFWIQRAQKPLDGSIASANLVTAFAEHENLKRNLS